jgi:hypothetical protein
MVVGATNVEGVLALETKDDAVLIVDANRVKTCQFVGECMQPIPWRH